MNNILWTEKYKPKNLKEIIINQNGIKQIQNWLINFETLKENENNKNAAEKKEKKLKKNIEKRSLLITGGHGVGKNTIVELVLESMKYETKTINSEMIKNAKKNPKEVIQKLLSNSSNVLNMMSGTKNNKYAIIVDEIESISSSNEKKFIITLQKMNEVLTNCPLLFISNGHHNKLLSEIKKSATEIRIFPPYPSEMNKILVKIANNEKILLNHTINNLIINHSQGDIRRLIQILQELKYSYGEKTITPEMFEDYRQASKIKDINPDLFKATEQILYDYKNIDECLKNYETEKVILPLMVHQNYIKSICDNYKEKDKYELIKKVSEFLSQGDVIENYIYADQNWNLQEIHGFYTCVAPSFYLNQGINKNPIKSKLKFADDLNKTSIKNINKKNIKNADKILENMNIFDYIYIRKIIEKKLKENDYHEIKNLFQNYDIKLEHIESLLKIDKNEEKITLTTKQKNELKKILNK